MNTYLISCESYRIIETEIKKITHGNNYMLFNMNKCSIDEIIDEASYISFDDSPKYLVVSNATFFGESKLKEEDEVKLLNFIDNYNGNTTIIFTTQNGIDLRKKITKRINDLKKLINIKKYDKKSINTMLTNYLNKKDYRIDYQTINYIIDNCYNSLDIMFQELDKIILFYKKPTLIKIDDVKQIVGIQKDNNNFHFVDAVINKNLKLALKLLKDLRIYKVEPTVLISLLAREYRLMYYVKVLLKENNMNDIINKLKMADWQVNKLYLNSVKYSEKELLDNLVSLCSIDLNIKNGTFDKDSSLYSFLLEACI